MLKPREGVLETVDRFGRFYVYILRYPSGGTLGEQSMLLGARVVGLLVDTQGTLLGTRLVHAYMKGSNIQP